MRVLCIDDETLVLDFLRTILTDAGHEVLSATNGNEGLMVLAVKKVDIVVTDILMPEKEGVETIIEIRKSYPNLRILAISGGGRMNDLQPLQIAGRIGADMTLPKPFKPEDLLNAIRKLSSAAADVKG